MTNKRRIGIAVPCWLYAELKEEAEYGGLTLNAMIGQILRDWIQQNRKERKTMWTCPNCGAHLDSGEKCDCEGDATRKESAVPLTGAPNGERQF